MRAKPLHASPIPPRSARYVAGRHGASAMGYTPMPVQRQIWQLLDATKAGVPVYPSAVVEVPRRSGKTDAVFALLVGRCATRPGHLAAYAAQTGLKSRARFLDLVRALGRGGSLGWKAYRARGEEYVEFDNGSRIAFYPPLEASFRGDAWDTIVLDEAQEVDPEDAADLLGGVLPSFDTRPTAQLVVSGTAGPTRDGLLWEALERGRAGAWGILEYAAPAGADVDDPDVWLDTHPGPAGVPPGRALEVLAMRHAQLSPEVFAREYLGIWPQISASVLFPADMWDSLGVRTPPAQPRRFGLAFEVTPDSDRAVVTASWRDGPITWGGVLREGEGTAWVPAYVAGLAARNRLPVWFDSTPVNSAVAAQLRKGHRGLDLHPCTALEYASGCALLHAEVTAGTFRHTRQPELDAAVGVAAKRALVDGGWSWGRKASTGYIHPLVAVSVGLRAFDSLPAERITRALSARVR